MAEALDFDLRLDLGGFRLEVAERVPLAGVTALTGPSGSGKTSLLRALAGLAPAEGRIDCAGEVWQDGARRLPIAARRIGMVFQEPRLFPHLDVAANLAYGARRRGAEAAIPAVVEALDLGPLLARRTGALSGGEARRVALGRALASAPRLLFLDEPLAGLDARRKGEVLPYLARVAEGFGLPFLYVTHAEDEVLALADRVLRLDAGRLLGWGEAPRRLWAEAVPGETGRAETVPGEAGLVLALGGVRFALPGVADGRARRQIALPPGGALLSRAAPGESGALATLKVAVRAAGPEEVEVDVAGQALRLPLGKGTPLALRPPQPGEALWLTLLSAVPVA